MEGRVYLIGCGIAKEHLTAEALNAISRAEVILYDRLIDKDILKINKRAKRIYVGKKPGESFKQSLISGLFLKYKNKAVARLHCGDSFLFGRGYEEYLLLREYGINCDVIPGISAFQILEKLGMPLTYRKSSSSIALITGSRADGLSNYSGICADTLIFYMPVLNLSRITARLKSEGKHLKSDFILIENAFKENYRVISGRIGNILDLAKEAKVNAPSLLVVGKIKRSINGNKVLLFRQKEAETETKKMLNKFKVVNIPLIKIRYNKLNIKKIPQNKVYAFTSPNAVKAVFSQLKLKKIRGSPHKGGGFPARIFSKSDGHSSPSINGGDFCLSDLKGKFVAIGDITKKAIESHGAKASVPKIQTSDGLMDYLKRLDKKEVVVFCSPKTNVKGFKKIYCYDASYLKRRIGLSSIDIVFPTSSEILRHLVKLAKISWLNKKTIVVIGPKVALEAKRSGLHVDFMLEKPDIGGLNDLL